MSQMIRDLPLGTFVRLGQYKLTGLNGFFTGSVIMRCNAAGKGPDSSVNYHSVVVWCPSPDRVGLFIAGDYEHIVMAQPVPLYASAEVVELSNLTPPARDRYLGSWGCAFPPDQDGAENLTFAFELADCDDDDDDDDDELDDTETWVEFEDEDDLCDDVLDESCCCVVCQQAEPAGQVEYEYIEQDLSHELQRTYMLPDDSELVIDEPVTLFSCLTDDTHRVLTATGNLVIIPWTDSTVISVKIRDGCPILGF